MPPPPLRGHRSPRNLCNERGDNDAAERVVSHLQDFLIKSQQPHSSIHKPSILDMSPTLHAHPPRTHRSNIYDFAVSLDMQHIPDRPLLLSRLTHLHRRSPRGVVLGAACESGPSADAYWGRYGPLAEKLEAYRPPSHRDRHGASVANRSLVACLMEFLNYVPHEDITAALRKHANHRHFKRNIVALVPGDARSSNRANKVSFGRCNESAADGIFQLRSVTWPASDHKLDLGLASFMQNLVKNGSLLDVGAGSGQYGAHFHSLRALGGTAPRYTGIDGIKGIEEFTRSKGPPGANVLEADVCEFNVTLPRHDWVMSLEVGEHLPLSCLMSYLSVLHRHARCGVVLSWANPLRGGGGCHINPRPLREVSCAMRLLGYEQTQGLTQALRKKASRDAKTSYLRRFATIYQTEKAKKSPRCASQSSALR